MKKLFYGIAALAIGFAAASCQQEGLEPAVNGSVTYEITLPSAPQTKGEMGYASYDLHYEVYKTSDVEALSEAQFLFDETVTMNGNTTTVSLELLNDQNYTILFWAHKAGTDYYAVADNNQSDLLNLQMNLDGIKSNNDDRDAFCAVDLLAKNAQSQTKEVKLVRPFSQVNIGTVLATDKFDIIPQRSQVTIKGVPTAFNVATGSSVGTLTDITFAEADVPAGTTTIKSVEYTNVAMNYIYVPEATVAVDYTIFTNNGNVSNEIDYVTVKKNHRTYIIGNLLTSNATYNIEVLPGFEDDLVPEVDGVLKDSKGAYYVSNAAGLEYMNKIFADQTAGRDVVLNITEDIDFAGKIWTTVDSHADSRFEIAEINGNGHTISNLTISGQAMFRRFAGTGDVVIKDITFDNANVNSNGQINTSILTGHTYQNVLLDNVDVKNSTITGGYKVAPLIATVYNEGPSTITATLTNCDVENVTVKATSYDFCTTGMVAFVYADDNDKVVFENCTVSDVKLYAPNAYTAHAAIYTTGSETLFNEAEGVTVNNVTFENI